MNDLQSHRFRIGAWLFLVLLVIGAAGCGEDTAQADASQEQGLQEKAGWDKTKVTASSYTLSEKETKKGHVGVSAFGERLRPEMHAVAVSRDLLKQGLSYGSRIRIEGLPGVYTVRDKMNKRWKNKIDILFKSRSRAIEWGRQKVTIRWRPAEENEG